MPDENIYNGDIGYISNIIPASESDSKKNEIIVNYDGNFVRYLPKDFNKIKLAYIVSVHKAQGSDFDVLIMPFTMEYNKMLYRKLIYTAVTRSKKKLFLIDEISSLEKASKNNKEDIRRTTIKDLLIKEN